MSHVDLKDIVGTKWATKESYFAVNPHTKGDTVLVTKVDGNEIYYDYTHGSLSCEKGKTIAGSCSTALFFLSLEKIDKVYQLKEKIDKLKERL